MIVQLALANAANASPPLEVKGVPLGATKQELLSKLPGTRCYPKNCFLSSSVSRKYKFGSAFVMQDAFRLDDRDRVGRVDIDIRQHWFGSVLGELTEKFGQPTVKDTEVLQNRMGARFGGRVATWVRGDGRIIAVERYGSIDDSRITFTTDAYEAFERDRAVKSTKEAAKKL